MTIEKEKLIRTVVSSYIEAFATGFAARHISEVDDEDGVINMKIHNVFVAALGDDIQYYSALARSLDSSLGNILEKMAIKIASLHYEVKQYVEGYISQEQTNYIATILEEYKRHALKPMVGDYVDELFFLNNSDSQIRKRHESDYYLYDPQSGMHYLIELKIGGDLDTKKARSEKEALLEQYCILTNFLGARDKVKLYFATAYNRYGEGKLWSQSRVRQFFAEEELLISSSFWNLVCKSDKGYDVIMDEYMKSSHFIIDALEKIKVAYLQ